MAARQEKLSWKQDNENSYPRNFWKNKICYHTCLIQDKFKINNPGQDTFI